MVNSIHSDIYQQYKQNEHSLFFPGRRAEKIDIHTLLAEDKRLAILEIALAAIGCVAFMTILAPACSTALAGYLLEHALVDCWVFGGTVLTISTMFGSLFVDMRRKTIERETVILNDKKAFKAKYLGQFEAPLENGGAIGSEHSYFLVKYLEKKADKTEGESALLKLHQHYLLCRIKEKGNELCAYIAEVKEALRGEDLSHPGVIQSQDGRVCTAFPVTICTENGNHRTLLSLVKEPSGSFRLTYWNTGYQMYQEFGRFSALIDQAKFEAFNLANYYDILTEDSSDWFKQMKLNIMARVTAAHEVGRHQEGRTCARVMHELNNFILTGELAYGPQGDELPIAALSC